VDYQQSYTTDGTDFLSMDEFYGLSYGGGASVTLAVFVKDTAIIKEDVIIYASINGGMPFDIYDSTVDGALNATCLQRATISTPLAEGNTVTFSTDITCIMAGLMGPLCPNVLGSSATFTTDAMALGTNSVYLTIKSDTSV
jgi:hypothetical protein